MSARPLCVLACQWSASPNFWAWAGVDNVMFAKAFILRTCGVSSRTLLDVVPSAGLKFHAEIRLPYMAHLRAQSLNVDVGNKESTAAKLLRHGELSLTGFVACTGWPLQVCELVLERMLSAGRLKYVGLYDVYRLQ